MRRRFHTLIFVGIVAWTLPAICVPKPHVVGFGKWTPAKWYAGPQAKPVDVKIRALYVDTRLKEFTVGLPHEVTDRLFVVRRMFRLNDSLPTETPGNIKWAWERGGWLLVDRVTGRVSQLTLPEFDVFYSTPSWYRDYVAYCGVSDDGKKLFAMVAQLGRRKAVLKKPLGEADGDDMPDSECPAPAWQRLPTRVTFEPLENQKLTFTVKGHAADVVNDAEEDDEGAE
jgi:hypothetical protein